MKRKVRTGSIVSFLGFPSSNDAAQDHKSHEKKENYRGKSKHNCEQHIALSVKAYGAPYGAPIHRHKKSSSNKNIHKGLYCRAFRLFGHFPQQF